LHKIEAYGRFSNLLENDPNQKACSHPLVHELISEAQFQSPWLTQYEMNLKNYEQEGIAQQLCTLIKGFCYERKSQFSYLSSASLTCLFSVKINFPCLRQMALPKTLSVFSKVSLTRC
jgi:hypothetical protein